MKRILCIIVFFIMLSTALGYAEENEKIMLEKMLTTEKHTYIGLVKFETYDGEIHSGKIIRPGIEGYKNGENDENIVWGELNFLYKKFPNTRRIISIAYYEGKGKLAEEIPIEKTNYKEFAGEISKEVKDKYPQYDSFCLECDLLIKNESSFDFTVCKDFAILKYMLDSGDIRYEVVSRPPFRRFANGKLDSDEIDQSIEMLYLAETNVVQILSIYYINENKEVGEEIPLENTEFNMYAGYISWEKKVNNGEGSHIFKSILGESYRVKNSMNAKEIFKKKRFPQDKIKVRLATIKSRTINNDIQVDCVDVYADGSIDVNEEVRDDGIRYLLDWYYSGCEKDIVQILSISGIPIEETKFKEFSGRIPTSQDIKAKEIMNIKIDIETGETVESITYEEPKAILECLIYDKENYESERNIKPIISENTKNKLESLALLEKQLKEIKLAFRDGNKTLRIFVRDSEIDSNKLFMKDDYLMIPITNVFNKLQLPMHNNYNINDNKKYYWSNNIANVFVEIAVGQNYAYDKQHYFKLKLPPEIKDDQVYITLSDLYEFLNGLIIWDKQTATLKIYHPTGSN